MIETIAYLGPKGSFTYEAARTICTLPNMELVPYQSIPDVLTAVDQGIADLAVVPVENAIEGSVNLTVDWLIHHVNIPIISEIIYPISQNLILHPHHAQRSLQDFRRIYSHPQAIAQCQNNLRELCPQAEIIYTNSTSEAVAWVREHPEEFVLAIGSRRAAELNQLHLKQTNIQDHQNNYTRFIIIGNTKHDANIKTDSVKYKTSLKLTLPSDYPGGLHQALSTFAWRKINLSHIESRPTKKGLGNYYFIIDAELPQEHVLMRGAIAELIALGYAVKLLGSYPSYLILEEEKIGK